MFYYFWIVKIVAASLDSDILLSSNVDPILWIGRVGAQHKDNLFGQNEIVQELGAYYIDHKMVFLN